MSNVIVTGASRGLGLGIAERLATAGYDVVAVARRRSDNLAARMRPAGSGREGALEFRRFDLADISGIPDFVRDLRKEFGPFYGLVNNAAIGTSGVLALMPVARIEEVVRVNMMSPVVLTKCIVRSMLAEACGRIVNIASILGINGYPGVSVYSATKAALIGFTRALASEVGPSGITVNAVAPGFLETEMTQDFAELRAQVVRRAPLRRIAQIDDVAGAVEFLLGPGAKNITGTVLTVDAGSLLR
jgi:3-oxoacyl-[acyl-carrier protein] reductase